MLTPLCIEEFESRTGILPNFVSTATKVVSLRQLSTITAVLAMPKDYLGKLLRNVTLEGHPELRPYQDCEIKFVKIDPSELVIGQTFVQRSKYQGVLEQFGTFWSDGFCLARGIASSSPMIIFGQDELGQDVVAHYIPPIIESVDNGRFLLDGIHRNYLTMQVGTSIESIIIEGVKTPLPCEIRGWSDITIVNQKPPRNQRFINLQPQLFRNLGWVGVDG